MLKLVKPLVKDGPQLMCGGFFEGGVSNVTIITNTDNAAHGFCH